MLAPWMAGVTVTVAGAVGGNTLPTRVPPLRVTGAGSRVNGCRLITPAGVVGLRMRTNGRNAPTGSVTAKDTLADGSSWLMSVGAKLHVPSPLGVAVNVF